MVGYSRYGSGMVGTVASPLWVGTNPGGINEPMVGTVAKPLGVGTKPRGINEPMVNYGKVQNLQQ